MAKSTQQGRQKARRFAVQALYQHQFTSESANTILMHLRDEKTKEVDEQFTFDNDMSKTDTLYLQTLVKGVIEESDALDALYAPHISRGVGSLDYIERAILRLGAFELKHQLEIPYRVVINECVELAKSFGAQDGFKFVNGVMDKMSQTLRAMEVSQKQPKA